MVIELRVVQFWSEIILVISNRNRAACSFDFEITRMFQTKLHSTQFNYHYLLASWLLYITFLWALLSLQVQLRNINMHNKTIIGFGFRMIAIIIKASVFVIRLSLRLRQITKNFGKRSSLSCTQRKTSAGIPFILKRVIVLLLTNWK